MQTIGSSVSVWKALSLFSPHLTIFKTYINKGQFLANLCATMSSLKSSELEVTFTEEVSLSDDITLSEEVAGSEAKVCENAATITMEDLSKSVETSNSSVLEVNLSEEVEVCDIMEDLSKSVETSNSSVLEVNLSEEVEVCDTMEDLSKCMETSMMNLSLTSPAEDDDHGRLQKKKQRAKKVRKRDDLLILKETTICRCATSGTSWCSCPCWS